MAVKEGDMVRRSKGGDGFEIPTYNDNAYALSPK